jgi:beta-1,2-mannobiose phosphorylase / 1,2-beta-oligomannan phosphorylase
MAISFDRMEFERLGLVLKPDDAVDERLGVLNPACTRLPGGMLQLYPRMVAPGNISRIGSFRAREGEDGHLTIEPCGFALVPEAPYELRDQADGHGCEDPRVTFVEAIGRYVMAYVAFGPRGPEVASAVSSDGLEWQRIGLMHFQGDDATFADKDAAFFPEPVMSPSGVESLAFYHRPTLQIQVAPGESALSILEALPDEQREAIAIGYVPLDAVRADISALTSVAETHRLTLPPATWGTIKVGCGTPPVRVAEGWLSVIHGVDEVVNPGEPTALRYCAGVIVHDPQRLDRILYRSHEPLFVPEGLGEIQGTVGHVVFPTGIDRLGEREFDIYYGMADFEIGRGRLVL